MLKLLRTLAWLEGTSLLLLFFVAMPVKYGLGNPEPVRIIGMIHGLLFLTFTYCLFSFGLEKRWSGKLLITGFLSSFVPFGTFWFDRAHLAAKA
jgi:integral membrane protein